MLIRHALLALAGVLVLTGCARDVRLGEREAVRVQHQRGVTAREARLGAMRADGRVQFDGRATGRLPALIAQTTLAGDDGFRLRARWLLGTAADVVLRGDSLVVWVPAERLAFSLAGAGETLGVGSAGSWVARVLSATWSPPSEAWRSAVQQGELLLLRWQQGTDSLSLTLDAAGEAREARLWRDGSGLSATYGEWRSSEGIRWPHRVTLADLEGWLSCALTLESITFPPRIRPEWLELRLPGDARRIGWEELREWLDVFAGGG